MKGIGKLALVKIVKRLRNYMKHLNFIGIIKRNGKKIDDGYRAIHLYYQRDNLAYPIEIQLWCGKDYQFNVWSHRHIYKYDTPEIGKAMYELYQEGEIQNEQEFLKQLENLRGEQNGR